MALDASDTPLVSQAGPQDRPDAAPTRSSVLLALVRGLVAFGNALLATLNHPSDSPVLHRTFLRFGTLNLDLIVARLLRGIAIAEALEQRLLLAAKRIDQPPSEALAVVPRTPAKKRKRIAPLTPEADDAALLAGLPTAEEIAEQIRRRPIASVFADICRDLGLRADDPIFNELFRFFFPAIGRIYRVLRASSERVTMAFWTELKAFGADTVALVSEYGTGPPVGVSSQA